MRMVSLDFRLERQNKWSTYDSIIKCRDTVSEQAYALFLCQTVSQAR